MRIVIIIGSASEEQGRLLLDNDNQLYLERLVDNDNHSQRGKLIDNDNQSQEDLIMIPICS